MVQATDEDYEAALKALGGLISSTKKPRNTRYKHAYEGMRVYLERLELHDRLKELRVVHVAGTKGKGSTCAMVESILRHAGYKTGLFTSPHLVDVRERIRLNGEPISRELFLHHFWWCHQQLEDKTDAEYGMAAYFRFLTLVGLRVFLDEGVDVAILEVGLGGRLDATNCIPPPVVCGITALGFDHMDILGHTLPEIAREKAGILKPGARAFSVPQQDDAMSTLQEVAGEVGISLAVIPPLQQCYQLESGKQLQMRLTGDHQLQNASLAVALASAWEASAGGSTAEVAERQQQLQQGLLPAVYAEGIETCEWPGRSQVVRQEVEDTAEPGQQISYFLDGAHTPESMATCGEWFASCSMQEVAKANAGIDRVLIFNCMQTRDPESLLTPLISTLQRRHALPQHALFVLPDSSYTSLSKQGASPGRDISWQQRLASIWRSQVPEPAVISQAEVPASGGGRPATFPLLHGQDSRRGAAVPSLSDTVRWLSRCAREQPRRQLQVLVTGSLYVVGDVLRLLGKAPL